jgi:transposase
LPTNQPGARRVNDRRVISGIIHGLRIGCWWADCPPASGPPTTIYNRFNRWRHRGLWGRLVAALAAPAELPDALGIDSTAGRAHRSADGGKGGENSGQRPLAWRPEHHNPRSDRWLRAGACALSPGNHADIAAAPALLEQCPAPARLLADKGSDANSRRNRLAATNTKAVIPATTSRTRPIPHDAQADRDRNRIERAFCRLPDWRRLATRDDRLAINFAAAVAIAARVLWRT